MSYNMSISRIANPVKLEEKLGVVWWEKIFRSLVWLQSQNYYLKFGALISLGPSAIFFMIFLSLHPIPRSIHSYIHSFLQEILI